MKHVIHPAHIPFQSESQASTVPGLRHHGPGGGFLCNHQSRWKFRKNGFIELLQKSYCFQVFFSAILIWGPFAVLPAIIQIQHRSHCIHPKAIDVIFIQPEHSAGNQKTDDFIAAVVKHQRTPVLMLPFSGICIFITRGSVKSGKPEFISGEMGRHPIHNNADAGLVALVHKIHKILWLPIARGRCKISGNLISPGAVERIFHQRHEFHMGISHFFYIGDQFICQLLIGKSISVLICTPRACMHFIHVHGLREDIPTVPPAEPFGIAPFIAGNIIIQRRVLRPGFVMIGIWVAFHDLPAIHLRDTVFIGGKPRELFFQNNLPHTIADLFHGVGIGIPLVEIPH